MAEKKKKTTGRTAVKDVPKKASRNIKSKSDDEQYSFFNREKKPYDENSAYNILMPYVCFFAAILAMLAFVFQDSMMLLGKMAGLLQGLCGVGAWVLPLYLIIQSFMWKLDAPKDHVKVKAICAFFFAVFLACFIHMFRIDSLAEAYEASGKIRNALAWLYDNGKILNGGGVLGGGACVILNSIGGKICVGFVSVVCVIIFGLFLFGWTISDVYTYSKTRAKELYYDATDIRRQRREMSENAKLAEGGQPSLVLPQTEQTAALNGKHGRKPIVDVPLDDENAVSSSVKKNNPLDVPIDDDREVVLPDESTLANEPGAKRQTSSAISIEAVGDIPQTDNSSNDENEVDFPEEGSLTDSAIFEEIKHERHPNLQSEPEIKDTFSIDEIFAEGATIAGAGTAVDSSVLVNGGEIADASGMGAPAQSELPLEHIDAEAEDIAVGDKPKPEDIYKFPSIDLLEVDPNPATFEINEELRGTSVKLVETLTSFGVRTKIMNISCGPTVTRYELKPDVGVKVRAIQNLADDIALHLSASGVRIEAPIPGKDAVGIEIPNKTVSTVYIRNLIETSAFGELKSRVSMCLGMDVAGSPIYMDMAKMPHLLIAGATGMGKSVCINSFIVSLLYKARPDEVKLILIDPKKVEFGMYNGIPHLLVPVVSDPKKAAGSLAWAVNEMERRFTLIEAVGVREIKAYNKITANDPDKEFLPQIVIIIDELADLMMTAKDEVESSICRLAQKARAAGMYLIIGTQRPSVDVITGLIKANVPSRIAFTVASQVDSRTIIDIAGAEKLMGRGDMLYAPVGCLKPLRVQGSWVSENEVEAIVESLKKETGTAEYDSEIIESIEKEALHCGEKKRGRGAIGGEDSGEGFVSGSKEEILSSDDMILPAIELGLESGQLSTSLLQRRLSLGYARAARILDKLTDLGFVSPFEGSKPRHITISTDEYMELKMRIVEGKQ